MRNPAASLPSSPRKQTIPSSLSTSASSAGNTLTTWPASSSTEFAYGCSLASSPPPRCSSFCPPFTKSSNSSFSSLKSCSCERHTTRNRWKEVSDRSASHQSRMHKFSKVWAYNNTSYSRCDLRKPSNMYKNNSSSNFSTSAVVWPIALKSSKARGSSQKIWRDYWVCCGGATPSTSQRDDSNALLFEYNSMRGGKAGRGKPDR